MCWRVVVSWAMASVVGVWWCAGRSDAGDTLFPFVLPWDDATPGVTDLSGWLQRPAGKFGHVRVGEDGHLYAGTERIRFYGVDLAFSANIPLKPDAEKIAARMAKFGVNIVRFHIMDMRRFPEGILARDGRNTRPCGDRHRIQRLQQNQNGSFQALQFAVGLLVASLDFSPLGS